MRPASPAPERSSINGQHEPANRTEADRAILRGCPRPAKAPTLDWFESFDVTKTWTPFQVKTENNGFYYYSK